jgi:hypothetical protein
LDTEDPEVRVRVQRADLHNSKPDEKVGLLTIADKRRNICFVQGLYSEHKTIVSRNHDNFDTIAETTLRERERVQQ